MGAPRQVSRRRQWQRAGILAWRDWIYEWRLSLCLVLGLVAVLAPLLVLFGLKQGIVTTMTERLRADPRYREITLRGHYQLDDDWFKRLAELPDVGFVVPRTRVLNATVSLETPKGASLLDVDMIPTAAGDPLLDAGFRPPGDLHGVLLTATAAHALSAGLGDHLEATFDRRLDGRPEAARLTLVVTGVLPETAFARNAVFVSLPLLIAAEDYRDGDKVPELGVVTGIDRPDVRLFSSFRLYARDLADVAPLARWLRDQGLEVVTQARDIEAVQAIDRVLTFVFVVLASIGIVGYLLSLASSLWANIDRKRRELALLRLIGFGTGPVAGVPAFQALLVAVAGVALSTVIYLAVAAAFNEAFLKELGRDEFVCRLSPADILTAGTLTIIFAVVASLGGGYRAARIEPAECLRQP